MADMFNSFVAIATHQPKTAGKDSERAPGISPMMKDGIWNERALAYGTELPSSLLNGIQSYFNFNTNANAQVGLWNGVDTGFGINYISVPGKVLGATGWATFAHRGIDIQNVSPPFFLVLSPPFSYSCWANALNDTQVFGTGKVITNASHPASSLKCVTSGGGVVQYSTFAAGPSSSIPVGVWAHLLVTKDAGGVTKLYLNGVEDAAQFTSVTGFTLQKIGSDGGNVGFIGSIDEVGVWNRVLTAPEIAELYNSGSGISYPFGTS